ncbi:ankyrin repeat-containing domain protein [Xylariales sp. PMI_506]|nr:ankyrin repeat-containing domain protein [Xylariales sp. PMI_506]
MAFGENAAIPQEPEQDSVAGGVDRVQMDEISTTSPPWTSEQHQVSSYRANMVGDIMDREQDKERSPGDDVLELSNEDLGAANGHHQGDVTSHASSQPPSPAQTGLREDPEWIMISSLSGLRLASQSGTSVPNDSVGDWSTTPFRQLEEQFFSRAANSGSSSLGPKSGASSGDVLGALFSSKDLSTLPYVVNIREELGANPNFLPEQDAALINNEQSFETNFMRLLVFSMLNGFAGLHDIPMDSILKFLGRKTVRSVFLRILEESPRHTSRTLSDNLFRAAVEAKDTKVVKMLLSRGIVNVNETLCFFGNNKYSAVARAARLGALDMVQVMLAAGADVNRKYPPDVFGHDDIIGALITSSSPRDWVRNFTFKGSVTLTEELVDTVKLVIQAGAEVNIGMVMDAAEAFTSYELCLHLSECLKPSLHRTFFQSHGRVDALGGFTDDDSATQLISNMLDKCCQDECNQCLTEESETLSLLAVSAATHGHLKLVTFLIDHLDKEKFMSRILAAAISSENKDLIDLVLSHKPDLDPPGSRLDNFAGTLDTTPLAEAVRVGDQDLIQLFEAAGALERIHEGDRFESLILSAVEAGNVSYVQALINRVTRSKNGYRGSSMAVAKAIELNHDNIAWMLLDAGFDIRNAYEHNRQTALCAALKRRNPELVRAILDAAPSASALSVDGLKAAFEWCNEPILFDLVFAFSDFINPWSQDLAHFCQRCIETKNVPLFRRFVDRLMRNTREDLTDCLKVAVELDSVDMIQQLLDMGADPFALGPLQAALSRRPEILSQLYARASQPPVARKCIGAHTLKYVMAESPRNAEMLATLLGTQAVNLSATQWRDKNNKWGFTSRDALITPLGLAILGVPEPNTASKDDDIIAGPEEQTMHLAKSCGPNTPAIRTLLAAGSDPNGIARVLGNGHNRTPLHLAIEMSRADIVELLVRSGADVNQAPVFHMWLSPLQRAAELANLDMVRLLLRLGADANGAPHVRGGGTALQYAAISGSCPVAAELLGRGGAQLDALPSRIDGRWPLEGAAEHGRLDMIRLLWDAYEKSIAVGVWPDGFTSRHCLRAMVLAEKNGHVGCKVLIEELSGMDLDRIEREDYGALWLAY